MEKLDRISGLPDSLLVHIISFLPVEEAIASSLLSKRWKPLWFSLTTLHFYRRNFQSLPFFHRFVDKVLKLVDLKSVKKFVLHYDHFKTREHFRSGKINKWINYVIINKVEHLELRLLLQRDDYELPSIVFTSDCIKVLKLIGQNGLRRLRVGTLAHFSLPLVEELHLEYVYFSDFRSLGLLISACGLLEDLCLKFPDIDDYYQLDIGRLNNLVTADVPQSLLPLEALSNVTFLRLYWPWFLELDMWPFRDNMPVFYNLTHLECVADEWTKMMNCLINFPKLQKLVINQRGSSSSPHEPILDVAPCVSLHLQDFTVRYWQRSESNFEIINFIVKNARVLKTVNIGYR